MGKRGPKNQNLTQILVRLEPSQHEYVVKKSKEWDLSIAATIRRCISPTTDETKHLNIGRAFAELQKLCKCSIGLEINEHRDYYQSIDSAISELLETESISEAEIAKIRQRETIIKLQIYPETPIGFYKFIGSDLEEVLLAAADMMPKTEQTKAEQLK